MYVCVSARVCVYVYMCACVLACARHVYDCRSHICQTKPIDPYRVCPSVSKQEEFRRLYTQLELLKQRNMKLGNRHLQYKLSAMTEAANKEELPPDSTPSSPNVNGKRIVINLDDYNESTNV